MFYYYSIIIQAIRTPFYTVKVKPTIGSPHGTKVLRNLQKPAHLPKVLLGKSEEENRIVTKK